MDKLTKKERMMVTEMLKSIESADRKLAAGKIKASEHDSIIRGVREREFLVKAIKRNSLSDPEVERLSQDEYNNAYAAGYRNGFTEGLRKRLTEDMIDKPQAQ